MRKLLPLLLIIPVLEIYILVKAIEVIGLVETIVVILLTGLVGIFLAISEGKIVYNNINRALAYRKVPGDDILSGLCILLGGLMLLLPGVLTDIVGITLVLPITRKFYKEPIEIQLENIIRKGYTRIKFRW